MKKFFYHITSLFLIAQLSFSLSAKEKVLTSVPVTFVFQYKDSEGTVRPRDSAGKEIRTAPLEGSTEFTIKSSDGSEKYTYIWGHKPVVGRLGNKELIQHEIEQGRLSEPVSGWSIKARPFTLWDGDMWNLSYEIYFAKAEEEVAYCTGLVKGSGISNSGSFTLTSDSSGKTKAATHTGTRSYETPVSFIVKGDESEELLTTGLFSCKASNTSYYKDELDKSTYELFCIPGKAQIANCLIQNDNGHGDSYAYGSLTFGAPTAKDVP